MPRWRDPPPPACAWVRSLPRQTTRSAGPPLPLAREVHSKQGDHQPGQERGGQQRQPGTTTTEGFHSPAGVPPGGRAPGGGAFRARAAARLGGQQAGQPPNVGEHMDDDEERPGDERDPVHLEPAAGRAAVAGPGDREHDAGAEDARREQHDGWPDHSLPDDLRLERALPVPLMTGLFFSWPGARSAPGLARSPGPPWSAASAARPAGQRQALLARPGAPAPPQPPARQTAPASSSSPLPESSRRLSHQAKPREGSAIRAGNTVISTDPEPNQRRRRGQDEVDTARRSGHE